ncbi:MAG TPA: GNAT family N-acetyltransferase [Pseudomonadales bacterium]|nr:GNAT family N-acetyltransferase [Pseudomonadales bacterium]
MAVRSLANTDISPLASVLKHAFSADPGLRWVIPDDLDWHRVAGPWFTLVLKETLALGHGLTDAESRGVSLWEPPDMQRPWLGQLISLFRVVFMLRGNFDRALQVQAALRGYRPTRPYWYLSYIATDPEHQGSGIGGSLLSPVLELADRERLPVFLDCSNADNISFYTSHGFNLVDNVELPGGPTLWPMMREPR